MLGVHLKERYRIDEEIGKGGMGVTYRAFDTTLQRNVALKVLSEAHLSAEGKTRLLREAQAVAKLNHPNIVSVYDVSELDDTAFIVMEYIEGVSLHEKRPQDFSEIIAITRQICAALEQAHKQGIVHRDLKPENILIQPDGTAKLMDFGIARLDASRLTREDTIIGTVFYLAPEQALGNEIDGRADLYALGVMLFELTTGELPFTAEDPVAVISQHLHAPIIRPTDLNPQIPSHLDTLIIQLLSKDPDDRPGSAAEIIAYLDKPPIVTPETTTDLLEISALGGLSIKRAGAPVTGFASRKVEALFVYLLCARRAMPREVLAELLWDERSQTRALGNLRVALSSLRKLLGPYVEIARETVGLRPEANIWVDVSEIEDQGSLSSGDVEKVEKEISYYKGDFLSGFQVRDSRGFENWVVLERERIRAAFEQKVQFLLDELIKGKRWVEAIKWGEYWLAMGASPEPAFRVLMSAHAGLGDLASMSAVYQRCVEAIQEEHGIKPSDQTRELFEWLQNGGAPSGPPRAVGLDPSVSTSDHAARLLLDSFREKQDEILDVASLAVVYASRGDLGIGPEEAGLLVRSALHHGVDVGPWLNRIGSPEAGVAALMASYDEYPRPIVRSQIVEALKGLEGDAAVEALLRIGTQDDSPEVRAEAAVGAAKEGRLNAVVDGLIADLDGAGEGTAMAALVAVADEVGLPEGAGPLPRFSVGLALTRRRWVKYKETVRRQVLRAGIGVAIVGFLFGLTAPLFTYFSCPPNEFEETIRTFGGVFIWAASGALGMLFIMGTQAMATSFFTAVTDMLASSRNKRNWRLLAGAISGLWHAILLIASTRAEPTKPTAEPEVYVPVLILFGLLLGVISTFTLPEMGTFPTLRSQLVKGSWTAVSMIIPTIAQVSLVYPVMTMCTLPNRIVLYIVYMSGLAITFSRMNVRK